MIDGGVVGGGKVRVDAGVCRCWSCRLLLLHRGSSYMEERKEKRSREENISGKII